MFRSPSEAFKVLSPLITRRSTDLKKIVDSIDQLNFDDYYWLIDWLELLWG